MTESFVAAEPPDIAEGAHSTDFERPSEFATDVESSDANGSENFLHRYFQNPFGRNVTPGRTERAAWISALVAFGGITKYLEFKTGVPNHVPAEVKDTIDSGSHLLIAPSVLYWLKQGTKLDKLPVALGIAAIADYAVETLQALFLTKLKHHGSWGDTLAFTEWKQWHWENSRDLGACMLAAVGYRSRLWMIDRKKRKQAHEALLETVASDFDGDDRVPPLEMPEEV